MLQNEITLIFAQNLFFIIIFSFPFLISYFKNIISTNIDKITINLIIFFNISLIISFFQGFSLLIYFFLITIFFIVLIKKFKDLRVKYYFDKSLVVLFFILIFLSIDVVYKLEFDWDTKLFWYFKVLNFYQDQSFSNLNQLPVGDYPHLGSYVWYFFWKYPFDKYEYLGRLFYIFIYVVSIFSLCDCLKVKKNTKLLFSILTIFITYKYEYFSGDQDILTFALLIIISKYIFYLFDKKNYKNKNQLIFLILFSINVLLWIKNESLIFSFILIICLLFFSILDIKQKLFIFFGFFSLVLIKYLIYEIYQITPGSLNLQLDQTLKTDLNKILFKVKFITYYFIGYSVLIPIYIINFLSIILTFLIGNFKKDIFFKFLLSFLILNICFMYLAYLLKSDDVERQVKASMKLFMFELSGFYILFFINFFNKFILKYK
tara:strand:+ start:1036 stop:2331 length:1296 start_codon:yes stop_codon:yes gene_type:complete